MNTKISTEYDGRRRKLYCVNCFVCKSEFWVPKHIIKEKLCCSSKCGKIKTRRRSFIKCSFCGKEIEKQISKLKNSKHKLYFCDRNCKEKAQCISINGIKELQLKHYGTAKVPDYRTKALRFLGKNCKECGYNQEVKMLDVDHIDGNRKNGNLENLQVLCVWCHALKTRKVQKHNNNGPIVHLV